jgi:hypothetical protein
MKAKLLGLAVFFGLIAGSSQLAQANVILTYVGNNFDAFSGDDACPPQCNLQISFSVSGSLTDYLAGSGFPPSSIDIRHPASFTFSDGLNTVTDQTIANDGTLGVGFDFVIDAADQPDFSKGWTAIVWFNNLCATGLPGVSCRPLSYMSSINAGPGAPGISTIDQTYHFVPVFDQFGSFHGALDRAGLALNFDAPGVWTVTGVPLPAALPLFAGAIGGLGVFSRWRRRWNATFALPHVEFDPSNGPLSPSPPRLQTPAGPKC